MILRIWRAPVPEDQVDAFQAFMQETLFPALAEDPACLAMTTAVDRSGGGDQLPVVVAVSTWTSMEGLRAFTGPEKESGVIFDEAAGFLADTPTIEHHEILDHEAWERSPPPP